MNYVCVAEYKENCDLIFKLVLRYRQFTSKGPNIFKRFEMYWPHELIHSTKKLGQYYFRISKKYSELFDIFETANWEYLGCLLTVFDNI